MERRGALRVYERTAMSAISEYVSKLKNDIVVNKNIPQGDASCEGSVVDTGSVSDRAWEAIGYYRHTATSTVSKRVWKQKNDIFVEDKHVPQRDASGGSFLLRVG